MNHFSTLQLSRLAMAISLIYSMPLWAQTTQNNPDITVFVERSSKPVDKLTNSVSVVTQDKIEKQQIKNIHDLQKLDPTISVRRNPSRFSAALSGAGRDQNSSFNIRGLEGSRVLNVVDGVRLPSAFSFGAQNFGQGDYVDMDSLKAIEIVRGASSTLHGSDGLAGAVSYSTLNPDDVLDILDKDHYGSVRVGYASEDSSWSTTARGAIRAGLVDLMAVGTLRRGHEIKNMGDVGGTGANRTKPNPQDYKSNNALFKSVWHINPKNDVALTFEAYKKMVDTDLQTSIATPASNSPTSVLGTQASDTIRRDRVSLEHTYRANLPWLKDVKWQAYFQNAKQNQFTAEDRRGVDRTRDNTYKTREYGLGSTAHSEFKIGSVEQRLTYGFDYVNQQVSALRNGTVAPLGETFPTPVFPKTSYQLGGVYIQDEIKLANGKIELTPGLRYDIYSLKPTETVASYKYINANLSGRALSPRLGVLVQLNDTLSIAANYAHGYKAPEPGQVNSSFANTVSNYAIIGNADLKAETSRTAELSLRAKQHNWSASLTGYTGWYKNFIEQATIRGHYTAANPTVFQYVNRARVRLSGLEGKAAYQFTPNWQAQTAFSYNKGKVASSNQPLNTINPLKVMLGVNWNNNGKTIGASLLANYHAGKKPSDMDTSGVAQPFTPPSFTTVDLSAYWKISKNFTLNAGINNLTNRKYWIYSDVRGLSSTATNLNAYTQAGRTYAVNLLGQF